MGLSEFDEDYVPLIIVAKELGVSDRHVRKFCEQGLLGKKNGKHWVVTRQELDVFKSTPRPGPGRRKKRSDTGGIAVQP